MFYLVAKALHFVGIVSWFAGLFYIVRLFIYHTEAFDDLQPRRGILTAQFTLMARRLWYAITVPAMILTAVTGGYLLSFHDVAHTPWLHLKFVFLAFLFGYHFDCGRIRKKLEAGEIVYSVSRLRLYNEVATFLLVGIVFTAVGKSAGFGLKGLLGCAVVFAVLATFFLKRLQGKK